MIAVERKLEIKQARITSVFSLKIIAVLAMFIDHFAITFKDTRIFQSFLSYGTFRGIGRIAFPIFAFLIVEGYFHTHDLKKYFFRLLCFAILSQIPYSIIVFNDRIYLNKNYNIFFTLLLGLVAISCIEYTIKVIRNNTKSTPIILAIAYLALKTVFWLSSYFAVDYGQFGIILILVFYFLREKDENWNNDIARILNLVIKCVLIFWAIDRYIDQSEIYALFALPILFTYNGEKGKTVKWFFYVFYPAHFAVLYFMKCFF